MSAAPVDDSDRADGFLARWSRRKVQVRQGDAPADPAAAEPVRGAAQASATGVPAPAARVAPVAAEAAADPDAAPAPAAPPAPTMADVAALTPESDFSRFVTPGVDGGVRNAALKKLFTDPHFNVMDGLDIYIDDYGKPDPLPAGMLEQMAQSRFLGLFTDEPVDAAADPATDPAADGPAAPDPAATDTAVTNSTDTRSPATSDAAPLAPQEPPPDENADLRLQPHDAAGPAGLAPGAGSDAGREH